MPTCNHNDWPCCGCGDDTHDFDDGHLCPDCGEPEACCCCNEYDDDCDADDRMDGDHETALRDAGWGVDEDYGCYGDMDCAG